MPTVNVNIPTPPSEAIIDTTVIPFKTLSIDKTKWYRVTDATPVPCIVSGASVNSSSALAFLEGESDGGGIISNGGQGTYDLATGVFTYGFVYDPINRILYQGVDPLSNTRGTNNTDIIYGPRAELNVTGDDCGNILYEFDNNTNICGNVNADITYKRGSQNNRLGNTSSNVVFEENTRSWHFSANMRLLTVSSNLLGESSVTSLPIDFSGATLLYNRTSPWEIIDVDPIAELIYVRFTYGDGSDPEEGWFDPATDTFTPISSSQVNSDWDAVSGVAEILNKPTIPAAQIQSDWTQSSSGAVDFIKNKPTIPTTYAETFVRNGQNQTFAAGNTRYLPVVGLAGNTLTVAAQAAQKIVRGGVIPSIGYTLGSSQPGTGSFVVTLMKGSTIAGLADTAAVITIAAGSAAGEYTYTGNITVNSGDYLVWKVVNNASGASGQDFGSWFEIVRTF